MKAKCKCRKKKNQGERQRNRQSKSEIMRPRVKFVVNFKLFSQKSQNPWSRTYPEAGKTSGWSRTRSPPPSGAGSSGPRPFWEGSNQS